MSSRDLAMRKPTRDLFVGESQRRVEQGAYGAVEDTQKE